MKNSLFGAICLVAGTTIGAGMIALPMTSATIGFPFSLCILIGMWAFMFCSAGLMIDISQGIPRSIASLCEEYIGKKAKNIAAGTLVLLFWSLLAAYIAGASSLVHELFGFDQRISGFLYCVIFGMMIVSHSKCLDLTNRALVFLKFIALVILMFYLTPQIDSKNLWFFHTPLEKLISPLTLALPIFFASFGFHGSIPSIIRILDGNRSKVFKAIFWGSLIPLSVYIIWQAMILGILQHHLAFSDDIGIFMKKIIEKSNTPTIRVVIHLFSLLAITTSFFGVGLGLFECSQEWFSKNKPHVFIRYILFTFLLPLAFALFYPSGFIYALGFAAMALSLFAVVLPAIVALVMKKRISFFSTKPIIYLLLLGGVGMIVIEAFRT